LEAAREGVDYSVRQLLWCGVLLSEPAYFCRSRNGAEFEQVDPWVPNALIESFLTNAHRISSFLHDPPAGDVDASDFLAPASWPGWEQVGPTLGVVAQVLSRDRYGARPEPSEWRTLLDPLADGMKAFIVALAREQSPWSSAFAPLTAPIDALRPRVRNVGS
jgi:hypothetical protein